MVAAPASKNFATERQNTDTRAAKGGTRLADAPIPATNSAGAISVDDAIVLLLSDVAVPAHEAGVVTRVTAGAGAKVKRGELLAVVGDPRLVSFDIVAPIEGEVVEVYLKEGEWAERGKSVARLIRLNQLIVEAFLDRNTYPPPVVSGRKVEAVVRSGKQGDVTFPGKIVYVSPLVEAGGKYRIRALVENRQSDGFWLLAPGLQVRLRILKEKA